MFTKEAPFYAQCTANNWSEISKEGTCNLEHSSIVPVEYNVTNTDCSQASLDWVLGYTSTIDGCAFCFLTAHQSSCIK